MNSLTKSIQKAGLGTRVRVALLGSLTLTMGLVVLGINHQHLPDLAFKQLLILVGVLSVLASIGSAYLIYRAVIGPIVRLSRSFDQLLEEGAADPVTLKGSREMYNLGKNYNQMLLNLAQLTSFANNIEAGNFEQELEGLGEKDKLGNALVQMRNKLKEVGRQDRLRNWQTEGLARFADLLRSYNDNLEEFGRQLISETVKYTGSNQGSLFLVKEGEYDEPHLELMACYAWDRQKHQSKQIRMGEGLTGQAWQEGETIYMTDIPDNYVNIASGLGTANPRALIIVPVKLNDSIFGILELASFETYEKHHRDFLQKLTESIASTIKNIRDNQNTKMLLQESRDMTEEMRAQEEEMRQNMEELQATQEEMGRKAEELQISNARANAVFDHSMDGIVTVARSGILVSNNQAASTLFGALDLNAGSQAIHDLIPDLNLQDHSLYISKQRFKAFAKDEQELQVEISAHRMEEDQSGHILIYIRDITEEVARENTIANNLTKLESVNQQMQRKQAEMEAQESVLIDMVNRFESREKELQEQLDERDQQLEKLKSN